MGNHEEKVVVDSVHLLMGFKRTKDGEFGSTKCIRTVIKNNYDEELEIFKAKLKLLGGEWRIHKTVNARDVKKAYKILLHTLIDFPEKASYIDSAWRTALLQRECIFGEKRFMFDVDTSDKEITSKIPDLVFKTGGEIKQIVNTPSGGFHIITTPFDCREVIKLGHITLLRDGYVYITTVKGEFFK